MTEVAISTACPEHAEIIAEYNRAMARETEEKELAPETILAGVKAVFEDEQRGFYLIATIGEEVVGCLMITTEWSDWRNGLFWWIQSVYVNPAHRGKGVFSRLYEHVRDMAESQPRVCGIRLYVEKDNERAQRTYLRLGMIETDYRLLEEEFSH